MHKKMRLEVVLKSSLLFWRVWECGSRIFLCQVYCCWRAPFVSCCIYSGLWSEPSSYLLALQLCGNSPPPWREETWGFVFVSVRFTPSHRPGRSRIALPVAPTLWLFWHGWPYQELTLLPSYLSGLFGLRPPHPDKEGTLWSWALLERLQVVQPLEKSPECYGTRRFITSFTRALHLSLTWARLFQSIPHHSVSPRSFLILSSHLSVGLASGLFSSGFPTITHTRSSSPPFMLLAPPMSSFLTWLF
jgi:hypothetical protein